ncbi:methyltransferase domain-containing protein [Pontivivens insulae]|uniref:Trans-aconitate 2-methyltransferase n=1 Tax=Pontivivens insulae TaxID=1639689 RepID=A0A2R8A8P1_9RHOB|nr:methyltransferase domain-containing protein [Pontivivens insulae]RED18691.1 trans-aconitate 2-methyltransferase [Pontivivens insulae]SPF28589.1 Trans-aconitate 2-methyltransferase [Pontivivens insulae]
MAELVTLSRSQRDRVTYTDPNSNWDAGTYDRFRRLRLRPALDLLAQVPALPDGDVIDLGCGSGAVAADLHGRFASDDRCLIGVDRSLEMLEKARALNLYDRIDEADIAYWAPHAPVALIFSNAALHWLPDHETLFPRLASMLSDGGVMAVQMPRQFDAPSHVLIRTIAEELFALRPSSIGTPPVSEPAVLFDICAPLGQVTIWETEYCQQLPADPDGAHPVRTFTRSTAARPVHSALDPDQTARFFTAYDAALEDAYPRRADGSVLFPFRRQFLILKKD